MPGPLFDEAQGARGCDVDAGDGGDFAMGAGDSHASLVGVFYPDHGGKRKREIERGGGGGGGGGEGAREGERERRVCLLVPFSKVEFSIPLC